MPGGREWLALEDACVAQIIPFLCLAAVLCAGCAKKATFSTIRTSVDSANVQLAYLPVSFHGSGGTGTVFAASRFVAVRHKLEIVEAGSGLPKSIEAVVAFCGTIQCEVLSSSVANETAIFDL